MKLFLSWIYGLIAYVRNLLYDEHVLYSYVPKLPTVCVGNLAVGGTGKTPHTEYLVDLLLREGYKVAVLSRGYKRRSKGFLLANEQSTADMIGDEPRQMQLKFPDAIVAVAEDRVQAVRRLARQFPDLDVIVLDDAFQHRKLRCGFNIILTPFDRLYVDDHMMPRGRLRDHAHSANRADVIVVSKCPEGMRPIDRRVITTALHCPTFQDLCFSFVRYADPVPVFPEFAESAQPAQGSSLLLLTGIAQPQYLREHLGERVVAELTFPDHHRYAQQDMGRLTAMLQPLAEDVIVLTTEKDAARLRDSQVVSDSLKARLYYLPISVDLGADAETLNRKVLRYVKENRRLTK